MNRNSSRSIAVTVGCILLALLMSAEAFPTATTTSPTTGTPTTTTPTTTTPTATPTTGTPTTTTPTTLTPTTTTPTATTPAATPTYTFTHTSTNTPTNTPTRTPTKTPTNTPTNTPTRTPTNTPTNTPTSTPTRTPTNTPTNTSTNTPTSTPTNTPTRTPTNTPTNTPTDTPTRTPTNTPTFTSTNTSTNTPTITNTPTDKCGTPYGKIYASGNVEWESDGYWYSPIGAVSTYTAEDYGDKDWDGSACVDDSIMSIQWQAVNFTPATSYGESTTLTATTDPATGKVKMYLDDAGYIVEDGGYVLGEEINVRIVIPDKETTSAATVYSCTRDYPTAPYGCNHYYSATVARSGVSLSFDHCKVCEDGFNGFTKNECGFTDPSVGHCELSRPIAGNTWSSDHVAHCRSANTNFPSGCTSTFTTNWKIQAPGGAWHLYHVPTYTFHTDNTISNLSCSRSSK